MAASLDFLHTAWSLLDGRLRTLATLLGCLLSGVVCGHLGATLPVVPASDVGMDPERLQAIDSLVAEHLARGSMPGCVVAVGRHGRLVWLKAYGDRQKLPEVEPMTVDTIFDLASLTKPVATATSIMILVAEGRLRLSDRIVDIFPEFGSNAKDRIIIRHLLTHTSGLIADNPLKDYADGPGEAWRKICNLSPLAEPEQRFIYSDVNFIVLGKVVEKVSGETLDVFSRKRIFDPLGMKDTYFCPPDEMRSRIAPTEQRDGRWLRGEVHDPRAAALGGIAGHAGLFSTAQDLAVYAQMLIQGGEFNNVKILGPVNVAAMTADYYVPGGVRGLGWDKRSSYSGNRADLYSSAAFGHGGFTGTGMWIDPRLDMFVIFLSNRLHPDGRGSVNPLIAKIGNIAAASITDMKIVGQFESLPRERAQVKPGIDVLREQNFALLQGQRVGLITNPTGVASDGRSTVELLRAAPGVKLVALFSPEHGWQADAESPVIPDAVEPNTGLPIYSLYGKTRKPTPESLQNVDTLVFDIQDIGCRFYTYISTMGLAMEAASENGKRFVVLDRPNPINGTDVEGPMLDAGRQSFVGFHSLPVRHGMTVGELARMMAAERGWPLDLTVVPVQGWHRRDYYDATGLLWVNPSPNMRSLTAALLYPGIGLLETTNLSVGRGTDTPFEVIGAPWIEPISFAEQLNALPETQQAGRDVVRFIPVWFTPKSHIHADTRCGGVRIVVLDREALKPVRLGLAIARQLRIRYSDTWKVEGLDRLLGNATVYELVRQAETMDKVEQVCQSGIDAFLERRKAFLLYR